MTTAPDLTAPGGAVTLGEGLVKAAPQPISAGITLTDPEGDFDGGSLVVGGLLHEDRVSILSLGTGPGQVSVLDDVVSFEGVAIGTFVGGVGQPLTVSFNAAATTAAVQAVIDALAYSNPLTAPTETRSLTVSVTDAGGRVSNAPATPVFVPMTGNDDPRGQLDPLSGSAVVFADLDGDGDADLVTGAADGTLATWLNTGFGFAAQTGAANPFDGIDLGDDAAPALIDLDGDGDLDLVAGSADGSLRAFENTPSGFVELAGAANPFDGVDLGDGSRPVAVDLDGDGDADLVATAADGAVSAWQNTGTGFVALAGASNPFDGLDAGAGAIAGFVDLDGDGDLDLVVGNADGTLAAWSNTGAGYAALIGGANPFAGIDVGSGAAPAFVDLDRDGDRDLVIGAADGGIAVHEDVTLRGVSVTLSVTPEVDMIDGDAGNNTLAGTGGADHMRGLDGNDRLRGSAGADTMDGGDDIDWVDYRGSTGGVTVNLTGGAGSGGHAAGDTFIGIENVLGSSHADVLTGNGQDNQLDGGAGDDVVSGGGGKDVLRGGAGNDTLTGGAGNDVLFGGTGADVFVFERLGRDALRDFAAGEDMLDLTGLGTDFATLDSNGSGFLDAGDSAAELSVSVNLAGHLMLVSGAASITVIGQTALAEGDLMF